MRMLRRWPRTHPPTPPGKRRPPQAMLATAARALTHPPTRASHGSRLPKLPRKLPVRLRRRIAVDCAWTRRSRSWSWRHRRDPVQCHSRTQVRWSTVIVMVLSLRRQLCFVSCMPSFRSTPSSFASRSSRCGAAGPRESSLEPRFGELVEKDYPHK